MSKAILFLSLLFFPSWLWAQKLSISDFLGQNTLVLECENQSCSMLSGRLFAENGKEVQKIGPVAVADWKQKIRQARPTRILWIPPRNSPDWPHNRDGNPNPHLFWWWDDYAGGLNILVAPIFWTAGIFAVGHDLLELTPLSRVYNWMARKRAERILNRLIKKPSSDSSIKCLGMLRTLFALGFSNDH